MTRDREFGVSEVGDRAGADEKAYCRWAWRFSICFSEGPFLSMRWRTARVPGIDSTRYDSRQALAIGPSKCLTSPKLRQRVIPGSPPNQCANLRMASIWGLTRPDSVEPSPFGFPNGACGPGSHFNWPSTLIMARRGSNFSMVSRRSAANVFASCRTRLAMCDFVGGCFETTSGSHAASMNS